ncbi:hypothetical protein BDZ94DRAFT_1302616 [Collybia nuda]|uniref:Berberine/berberine-like domain-containing protein n=1 Tax=Collybia nuda TaxID=64659 RepID=A0A9P5XRH4_9AGAR|nr:hypothetical protein BDZ94DRAFT_1302616 [Collybia nuda]
MKNQQTLQSSYSNSQISIKTTRYSRWFEAIKPNAQLGEVFGEAIAFYSIEYENHIKLMMVYNPLGQLYAPLQTVICGRWSSPNQLAATETVHIQNLIGVWKAESQNIYTSLQLKVGLPVWTWTKIIDKVKFVTPTNFSLGSDYDGVEEVFGNNLSRLRKVKAIYDPKKVWRKGWAIEPDF